MLSLSVQKKADNQMTAAVVDGLLKRACCYAILRVCLQIDIQFSLHTNGHSKHQSIPVQVHVPGSSLYQKRSLEK